MRTRIISVMVNEEEYKILNKERAELSLKENRTVSMSEMIRKSLNKTYMKGKKE